MSDPFHGFDLEGRGVTLYNAAIALNKSQHTQLFASAFNNKQWSDLYIQVNDTTFFVHMFIVCQLSPFIANVVASGNLDNGVLDLSDSAYELDVVGSVLQCMYQGDWNDPLQCWYAKRVNPQLDGTEYWQQHLKVFACAEHLHVPLVQRLAYAKMVTMLEDYRLLDPEEGPYFKVNMCKDLWNTVRIFEDFIAVDQSELGKKLYHAFLLLASQSRHYLETDSGTGLNGEEFIIRRGSCPGFEQELQDPKHDRLRTDFERTHAERVRELETRRKRIRDEATI